MMICLKCVNKKTKKYITELDIGNILYKERLHTNDIQKNLEAAHNEGHYYICSCNNVQLSIVSTKSYHLRKYKGHEHDHLCPLRIEYTGEFDGQKPPCLTELLRVKKYETSEAEGKEQDRSLHQKYQAKKQQTQTFEGICQKVIDESCFHVNGLDGGELIEQFKNCIVGNFLRTELAGNRSFSDIQEEYKKIGESLYLNVNITNTLSILHGSQSKVAEEISYHMSLFDGLRNQDLNDRFLSWGEKPVYDTSGWLPKGIKKLNLPNNKSILANENILREAIDRLFIFKNPIVGPYVVISIVHRKKKAKINNSKYTHDNITKKIYISPVLLSECKVLPVESNTERRCFDALIHTYDCQVFKPLSRSLSLYSRQLKTFFSTDKGKIARPLTDFGEAFPDKTPIRPDLYCKIGQQYFVIEIAGFMKGADDRIHKDYVEHLEWKEEAFYQYMTDGIFYIRAYNEHDLVEKIKVCLV